MRDEKLHAVVAPSTFRSQNVQSTPFSEHFWTLKRRFVWQAHRTFEEDLQRCISRGRRNTRDTLVRCVRRSGRIFLEKGCILEHEIFRFAKMILRDKYSTSYDLASLFPGRRSSLNKWSGKIAKRIGTRPSPVLSTFHF